jgi:hypothetical protein
MTVKAELTRAQVGFAHRSERRRAREPFEGSRLDGERRGARVAAALSLALALLTSAGRAGAHPEFSTMGTNRYVTAAVFDGRVDVTDAWLEGALSAVETRRQLDTNRDGRIDDAERQAGEESLRAQGPCVGVELDGRPATAPLTVSIDLGVDPKVGPTPLVVERRTRLDRGAPPRETRLRLVVLRDAPRPYETELSVVLGPALALASGPDRVRFDGPRHSSLEDRSATFVVKSTPRPPVFLLPVLVLVLVAVLVCVLVLRRRRRPF